MHKKPKGLAFKLSLGILSATVIIIFGILYYNYHFSKKLLLESARETAEQLANSTLTRMESVLISAQRVPEGAKLLLKYPTLKKEGLEEMLGLVLQNKPEIYGCAVAFAPYAFDPAVEGYAPYCYRSGDDYIVMDLSTKKYRYYDQPWFTAPRDSAFSIWTEPYFDRGGGNVFMTTYSTPFYYNDSLGGGFRGVATADLSLGWLENMMNFIKVYETGYVFLVTEKGTVITHPVKEFQMQNIENLAREKGSEEWINIVNELETSREGYLPFHSLVDGRPCWLYFSTLPQTKWRMAVVFPEEELFAGLKNLFLFTIFMGVIGIILLSFIVIVYSAQIIKPLKKLTQTAEVIGGGNFDVIIREDRSTREINMLGNAFNRMQTELKEYIHNLEHTTAVKERFESELNIAHDIQQGMIPKIFPPFPDRADVDIYALLVPARQVGGDFYDFFFLDDETLCFAIGDVSDKGVPASLMMSMTITLFRAKADLSAGISDIVNELNRSISKDNTNLMFITFFMGILKLRTGSLQYCNAGHNYPLLLNNNGKLKVLSETHGIPLGIMEEHKYSSSEMQLEKGEKLVLYTDGITEALSISGEFYSEERLNGLVQTSCCKKTTKEVTEIIMNDVAAFVKTDERSDDITLMVLSYFPEKQR